MNIDPFVKAIETQKLNVEGIIVSQKGREIARHRWIPEAKRNAFSVSKSFASVAIGMAIDEGKLKLRDRVTRFFPRKKSDSRWDSLTLEHLLKMSMGHAQFTRPASLDEALSYDLVRDPGKAFLYDNTNTFLASAMLTKATGQKMRDYLLDRLFRPLGFEDPEWAESEDGYTVGATSLELTTSELAVFGEFLLRRGNWNGKQLVSPLWIDAATRTRISTSARETPENDIPFVKLNQPDYDLGYGYQFWTCRHGAYRCDGKDGQFVVVIPGLEAVIAINSREENREPILWTVWEEVLPFLEGAV